MADKPELHGRDHRPGGADPIPGLDDSVGIQFDTYNVGGWLDIQTTAAAGVRVESDYVLFDSGSNPNGVFDVQAITAGVTATGTLQLHGDDDIYLRTDTASTEIHLDDNGGNGLITITATQNVTATAGTTVTLNAGEDVIVNMDGNLGTGAFRIKDGNGNDVFVVYGPDSSVHTASAVVVDL